MLDLIVGIAIVVFVVLGLREGIVKALGSLALVFVALFLASGAIYLLAKGDPHLSDPNYLSATVTFLIVWSISYLFLDLILTIFLKKIITIIILGPIDKIGGVFIGGFKGFVICGIILQLVLYLPLSTQWKIKIKTSDLSRFCIDIYQLAYPYAQKIAPMTKDIMKYNLIKSTLDASDKKATKKKAEQIKKNVEEKIPSPFGKFLGGEEIKELLRKHKLLPTVPQEKGEETK
jgi:uncharacterized membrane protein required for colicin V production